MKNFVVLFFLTLCQVANCLNVLTYQSLLGKGSLGEFIKNSYAEKYPGKKITFIKVKELSGFIGELNSNNKKNIDVVLGLSELDAQYGLSNDLVESNKLFERGPFAIIVNTNTFKPKKIPDSWAELKHSLSDSLLLQDPRLSNTGKGWLRAIFEFNLISKKTSKKLIRTIFPSWSSSYSAFQKKNAPAVWSYLSSEAYHLCEGKTNFKALNLKEGYPEEREYVSIVKTSKKKNEAALFVDFVLSDLVQEQIPIKNWMFPAKNVKLPNCYKKLSKIKIINSKQTDIKEHQRWLDEWSLL